MRYLAHIFSAPMRGRMAAAQQLLPGWRPGRVRRRIEWMSGRIFFKVPFDPPGRIGGPAAVC